MRHNENATTTTRRGAIEIRESASLTITSSTRRNVFVYPVSIWLSRLASRMANDTRKTEPLAESRMIGIWIREVSPFIRAIPTRRDHDDEKTFDNIDTITNDCRNRHFEKSTEACGGWSDAAPVDFHASILTCELAQTDRHDTRFLKLVLFAGLRRSRRTRRPICVIGTHSYL